MEFERVSVKKRIVNSILKRTKVSCKGINENGKKNEGNEKEANVQQREEMEGILREKFKHDLP